eukprot:15450575-Alexandrium_andersonii.AAC.1
MCAAGSRVAHQWYGCCLASTKVGQAKVPGPEGQQERGGGVLNVAIETINTTSLRPSLSTLCESDTVVHCIQEHGLRMSEIKPTKCIAAKMGCDLCASPPAPGMLRASAGAAILAKKVAGLVAVSPVVPALKELQAQGRCIMGMLNFAQKEPLFVFSVYGWSGSHSATSLRESTQRLMAAVVDECRMLRTTSFIICGDMNCEIQDVPSVQLAISEGFIVDVASVQHLNGGGPPL